MKKNIYSILKQAKGSLNIRLQQQFSTRATLFPRGHLAMSADVQAGFRKGRGTRDRIANICYLIEKEREFKKKKSISALLTMPKPLTVWITINCGKF